MYLSIISAIFGILFIFSGIAGFIPGLYSNDLLYGLFYADPIHNIANFVIGFIALISALKYKRDRLFFQVFGVIYALIAAASFIWDGNLYITQVNTPDTVLHIILAFLFIALGFFTPKEGQV